MPEIPDIYCDSTNIATGSSDVMFCFYQRSYIIDRVVQPNQVGCVRMSLEAAKLFAIQLKKTLKAHEDKQGFTINMHPEILKSVGISVEEDW